MKPLWFLVLLFFGTLCCPAQQLDDLFDVSDSSQNHILAQAKDLYACGFFQKAVKVLAKQTRKKPDYFNGYIMLGYLHFDKQYYDQGALYFAKAVKINPKHTGALFMRGTCFLKGGKYRLALKDYIECIRIDNDFYPAYNNIAVVRLLYQDIENTSAFDLHLAKQDLDEVLSMENPDRAIVFNMGFIYLLLWEFDQALPFFNKAIADDAAFGKAWFYRGMTHYYIKHYADAKSDFQMAQQLGFQPERCMAFIDRLDKILNYLSLQKPQKPEGW